MSDQFERISMHIRPGDSVDRVLEEHHENGWMLDDISISRSLEDVSNEFGGDDFVESGIDVSFKRLISKDSSEPIQKQVVGPARPLPWRSPPPPPILKGR